MSIESTETTGGTVSEGSRELPHVRKRLPRAVRFGIPIAVLAIGAWIEAWIWTGYEEDATRQVMMIWYTLPVFIIALLAWWTFLSGLTWKVRLAGLGIVAAGFLAFIGLFRLKEFSGDMAPRFEARWHRTAEQRAADYWQHQQPEAGPASPASAATQAVAVKTGTVASAVPVEKLAVGPEDWPQFDGPTRDGRAPGTLIRTDWNRQPPREVWRHPVGAAWSSFAVVGNYAFTQEQRGADEAVVCYDAQTGKQISAHLDPQQRFTAEMAGIGPRATPTVHDSRVYTLGATGILNCLAATTGAVLWSKDAVADAGVQPLRFGMSGSPLVYDNLVVVNPGGPRESMEGTQTSGRAVIAYNRLTGEQVWAAGDYQAAYASPILATIGGVRQVIIYDALGAAGHDAATGTQLWRSPQWTNDFHNNIPQPIVTPKMGVFLSSGYGTGSVLLQVRNSGGKWTVGKEWVAPNRFKLKFNSGVAHNGCVYGLDEGILGCIDLQTGEVRWKRGHYGFGQILLFDNLLLVISEAGDAILLKIAAEGPKELGKFHAIEGKTWNHPAYSNGRLYVRNAEEAACFDLGPLQTASR